MEVCSIYFHEPAFDDILSRAKTAFPKANFSVSDTDDGKQVQVETKGGLFSKKESLTIRYRQRADPGYNLEGAFCAVSNQMRGMHNFVSQLPADNEELHSQLLAKIATINVEVNLGAEPKFSSQAIAFMKEIAAAYEGFFFAQPGTGISKSDAQQFLDKDFNLLIDTTGRCGNGVVKVQINSAFFDKQTEATPDQEERKKRSLQFLQQKGILINAHLPYTEAEAIVNIRTKQEVIERIYALALIAAMGEGVPREQLERVKNALSIDGLSPYEAHLYEKGNLSDTEKTNATWRYESLNALMWAAGYVDPLVYPDTICDVPTIVGLILNRSRQEFEAGVEIKNKAEILDELDKTYRMSWACVQGRIAGKDPGGGIHGGIVYERHYALNWLTCYRDLEWDDVSTDT
jgi:hypothetical protein